MWTTVFFTEDGSLLLFVWVGDREIDEWMPIMISHLQTFRYVTPIHF